MKKIFLTFIAIIMLTGCSFGKNMDNTPTKKVETYLNNYQTLDSTVLSKLDSIVEGEVSFNSDQKEKYKNILKKHYQNLTYNIKEETINGDKATVEVEIEVNDYTKILKDAETYKNTNSKEFLNENNQFDEKKYNDYKLEQIEKGKEKVKYTLFFSLTKIDDTWTLDTLTQTEEEKILGIYEY